MDEMTSVNIEQVADVQTDVVDTNVSESVNAEVATPQEQNVEATNDTPVKPVQDAETNSRYAEMRREQESLRKELAARDEWVKNKFGQYGVNTWADYQAQMEAQLQEQQEAEMRERGIEPDILNEYIEKNPKVREANEILSKMQAERAQQESAENFFKAHADVDPNNMPPEVIEAWATGKDMEQAYMAWDYNRLKSMDIEAVKQNAITEYIEKIKKGNIPIEAGGSSPVLKSEPPTTWEGARAQAMALLKGNNH